MRMRFTVEYVVEAEVPDATLDEWRESGEMWPDGKLEESDGFAAGVALDLLYDLPGREFWEGDAAFQTIDVWAEPAD